MWLAQEWEAGNLSMHAFILYWVSNSVFSRIGIFNCVVHLFNLKNVACLDHVNMYF